MTQLAAFGPEIWIAEGPSVKSYGFDYPTRMVVWSLAGGGVALWSPVAFDPYLAANVAALGPVRALIAPNHLHHLALADWAKACPEAAIYAAPGLACKRADINITEELAETAPELWQDKVDQTLLTGNFITTEAVFFHRPSKTAIFCDFLQQFSETHFSGLKRMVARADKMIGAVPQVPRKFRLATTERRRFKEALAPVLDWPAERVLMAHGAPVETGGAALIKSAFAWL